MIDCHASCCHHENLDEECTITVQAYTPIAVQAEQFPSTVKQATVIAVYEKRTLEASLDVSNNGTNDTANDDTTCAVEEASKCSASHRLLLIIVLIIIFGLLSTLIRRSSSKAAGLPASATPTQALSSTTIPPTGVPLILTKAPSQLPEKIR